MSENVDYSNVDYSDEELIAVALLQREMVFKKILQTETSLRRTTNLLEYLSASLAQDANPADDSTSTTFCNLFPEYSSLVNSPVLSSRTLSEKTAASCYPKENDRVLPLGAFSLSELMMVPSRGSSSPPFSPPSSPPSRSSFTDFSKLKKNKKTGRFPCPYPNCNKDFTAKFSVKRHGKKHLLAEKQKQLAAAIPRDSQSQESNPKLESGKS